MNNKIIDSHQQKIVETEISQARETVDYLNVEYPLEYFLDKITQQQIDNNLNWDKSKQSYFIESLMLGLPVFNIIFIDKDNNDGYSVIDNPKQLIDGKQRLCTAMNFINGNLRLENLKELESLNGFKFSDLVLSRQRKFKRITVKAIALYPNSDLSVWRKYKSSK